MQSVNRKIRRYRLALLLGVIAVLCTTILPSYGPAAKTQSLRRRVVVLVVVDQMRADYLERYADQFKDGFRRLARDGAVFLQARYPYATTLTAQAHALMLSGWSPSATGIVGDRWYDRLTKTTVTAGASPDHRLLESSGDGASPEQMQVHTVGDALKEQHPNSIVLTASWKSYAAVLAGGRHADAAYWFDPVTGHMVTSDYYLSKYPAWVKQFDAEDLTAPFFGKTWLNHVQGGSSVPDQRYRTSFRATPYANDVLLAFAQQLFEQSGVGDHDTPDLVAISFSALDYVGHSYGPETPEFDSTIMQMDRQLGDLLRTLDKKFGENNYTVALTSDHGVSWVPEKEQARGHDAGRLNANSFHAALEQGVEAKLGIPGPIVTQFEAPELYLQYATAAAQGASRKQLEDAVVAVAAAQPGIARVYTTDQILSAENSNDPDLQAVAAGYYPGRSGDMYVLVKPGYLFWAAPGTTHGSPYDYDRHVPLILFGGGVKPGQYPQPVRLNDLAPTVGRFLGIRYTGDPQSRVLEEALH